MTEILQTVRDNSLTEINGIDHAFFTRIGGVSTGLYNGLNVGIGSDDDQKAIRENRTKAANHMGANLDRLVTVYQTHSADVWQADEPLGEERPKADAIVTNNPDLVVGILTADCGPVLFADKSAQIVGAAHAGWKGAIGGVLENTISQMEQLGSQRENIVAVLGPCISQKNYEVGAEFLNQFANHAPQNDKWFEPSNKPDHHRFDLQGYIVNRLQAAGVTARATGHCTYEDEKQFYSYRRKTHRNEADFGRQLSAIRINGTG